MHTTTFLERVNHLPSLARKELFDFLKFLEWKYAEEIQPMADGEFEAFLGGHSADGEDELQLIDGDRAIEELRKAVKTGQSQP